MSPAPAFPDDGSPRAFEASPQAPVEEPPLSNPADPQPAPAPTAAPASEPVRRTVVIKGYGQGHYTPSRGGYETRLRPHERSGFKPDRVALWAVLLGLALLLGAVTSSHAAILHPALLHHLFQHAGTH